MKPSLADLGRYSIDCKIESVVNLRSMIRDLKRAIEREPEISKAELYRAAREKCMQILFRTIREFFDERAAIRQFDGGFSPERAKCLALDDTMVHFGIRDLVREREIEDATKRLDNLINLLDPKPSQIAIELDRIYAGIVKV